MKTMIKITHIVFFISTIVFAIPTEGTNIALLMEKGQGAFSMSSSLTVTPQKPSSDKDIGQTRYMHASLLLPSGIAFSFGNTLEEDVLHYNYLDASYFIKNKNYTIGANFRSHYNSNFNYGRKPKELGGYFSYKIPKQAVTPYLKYTLRQYATYQNLQLLTVGGFTSISQIIFSFSYTLPIDSAPQFYNSKGEISINIGVFLD